MEEATVFTVPSMGQLTFFALALPESTSTNLAKIDNYLMQSSSNVGFGSAQVTHSVCWTRRFRLIFRNTFFVWFVRPNPDFLIISGSGGFDFMNRCIGKRCYGKRRRRDKR